MQHFTKKAYALTEEDANKIFLLRDRGLKAPEIEKITGWGTSTVYMLLKEGSLEGYKTYQQERLNKDKEKKGNGEAETPTFPKLEPMIEEDFSAKRFDDIDLAVEKFLLAVTDFITKDVSSQVKKVKQENAQLKTKLEAYKDIEGKAQKSSISGMLRKAFGK